MIKSKKEIQKIIRRECKKKGIEPVHWEQIKTAGRNVLRVAGNKNGIETWICIEI